MRTRLAVLTASATAALLLLGRPVAVAEEAAGSEPAPTPTATAEPAAGPGGAATVSSVRPNEDVADVDVTAAARTEPVEYWLEYGETTGYGRTSARQVVPAGEEQRLLFTLSGLGRGTYHLRVVWQPTSATAPGTGPDLVFSSRGIVALITTTRPTGDGIQLSTSSSARASAIELWVEYGATRSYGQATAKQTVPAGQQGNGPFVITGLAPGTYHLRLVAQPATPDAFPSPGDDLTFTTSSTMGPAWPACSSDTSVECIRSFTIDGASAAGVRAEVLLAGGGLQMQAVSNGGGQDLLFAGSPVSATSTVEIVVSAGTFEPAVLLAAARVSQLRVDRTASGNVITFSGRTLPMSFTGQPCRVDTGCGDDTLRADHDQAGRFTLSAFPATSWQPAEWLAASRGMWISSNANANSTPGFNEQTKEVMVRLASPHLTAAGALNVGYYETFIPTAMLTDLWRVASPDELRTTVTDEGVEQSATPTWTAVPGGWLLRLTGFHYSSPSITLRPGVQGPAPTVGPSPAPTAPAVAPALSLDRPTISAGERFTALYRGTPGSTLTIWSRTQPATGYSRIGTVVLDATGNGSSSHAPRKNTRMMATTADGLASGQPLVQVRSVASFNARRVATRTFTFSGTVSPALSGRLVTVYRNGVLVAQARTSSTGVYTVTRTLAAGTFSFFARTPNDTSNLGATSRTVRLAIG